MTDGHLLFITLPVLFIAAFALLKGIPKLMSAMHVEAIADLPLTSGGTVEVAEAGELILCLRGKLGGIDFATATFTLRDAAGAAVPSSMILVRASRTGMDGRTTLAVRRFAVPAAGRYQIDVAGIDAAKVSSDSRLLLTRPSGTPLRGSVLWVVAAAVALLLSIVFLSIAAFAQRGSAVYTPAAGSPLRVGVMDVTRQHLGLDSGGSSRFKVFHLKTNDEWTYFEGNEIVDLGDGEWQETDLTVKALFQFEGKVLRVRALWSLPDNDRLSLQEFERQVVEFRASAKLPEALFPDTPNPATDPFQAAKERSAARKPVAQDMPNRSSELRNALFAAIKEYDLAAAQAAVAQGADLKAPGDFRRTPLHEAVLGVNVELVEWLLENGADPNATDNDGRTPLHRANEHHLPALRRHGADLHRLDRQGNTALHIAAERYFSVPFCKGLVQAGIALNARNRAGLTPLHFAVLAGNKLNLATLIDLGADVNARTTAEYAYKSFDVSWSAQGMEYIVPAGSTPISLARRLHKRDKWVDSKYETAAEFLLSKGAVERKWWRLGGN
ncbi:MAG: ankyrin repeat domain-containing protein [Gammaproteobacteria bacterium]